MHAWHAYIYIICVCVCVYFSVACDTAGHCAMCILHQDPVKRAALLAAKAKEKAEGLR